MNRPPDVVARFLAAKRLAVAGVSRDPRQPANAIFRRLRASGRDVLPVNPMTAEAEGTTCYPDIAALPGPVDGVVIATPPEAAEGVVRQCAARGIRLVWFHRSFGTGSVSPNALRACSDLGVEAIVGGCPLMFAEPVDLAHRCMRWWLQRRGSVPT